MMPFDQPNQISIPTNGLLNQVSIQMPTYQAATGFAPQIHIAPNCYTMPYTASMAEPFIDEDQFMISIPMGQQIQLNKQTEVVLKLGEGKKKSKSQMN